MNRVALVGTAVVIGSLTALTACEKKSETPPPAPAAAKPAAASPTPPTPTPAAPAKPAPASTTTHDDHGDGHDHAGHDHDHGSDGHGDHGPAVPLDSATIGAFQVKASRDGGITPGGDAPIDLWITPSGAAKVGAVRAWIGTQDAKGSVKAKMDLEKENFHSHVEVPKPLPAGSKLWVEIEDDKGAKSVGSFDLKS